MTKRNNEERLGLPTTGARESIDASAATHSSENGLSFVAPTQMVDLPSEGKYYAEGHPLHNKKEIEIKEMTAKEEDILVSRSLIRKGLVFDKLLRNIIIDGVVTPENLLIGDKNAILVAARISGYGEEYDTSVSCPGCMHNQRISFDLLGAASKTPKPAEEYSEELGTSVVLTADKTFAVTLPKSQVEVEISLATGKDERKLVAVQEMKKKRKMIKGILTEQLKICIVSVDGDDNPDTINRFVDNMPAKDSRFIRNVLRVVTPNIDLTQEFVCEECDHEQDLEVPINPEFFWPDK
jgi:hypothetical protein